MYKLYAKFGSKKERDLVWQFLTLQDFSLWHHSEWGVCALKQGEHMEFSPRQGAQIIGFHEEALPQKTWALIAWLATKSSVLHETWHIVHFDDEEIPVQISNLIHDQDVLFVNEDGILNSWIDRDVPLGPQHDVQKKFMQTLDHRFKEYFAPKKEKAKKDIAQQETS